MEKTPARYWSHLKTILPARYRHRTALTPSYVLEVSGQECGRRHKAVLYQLMLTGSLRPVWKQSIMISETNPRPEPEAAKALALELIGDMLESKQRRRQEHENAARLEQDLQAAVTEAMAEYMPKKV